MGKKRCAYSVLVGKPQREINLEDLAVDWRIILKWVFKKWNEGVD
jgi:hypothetical protein